MRLKKLKFIKRHKAIRRAGELSHLAKYQADKRDIPIAAYVDVDIDEKELRLIREDIDEL